MRTTTTETRLHATTMHELADGLRKDRDRVVEALVFLARDMTAGEAYVEEYASHMSDLAHVVTHLEDAADEIEELGT